MDTVKKIFFLAVNTGMTENSKPNNDFLNFYVERASPDLYCSIVGNVVLPDGFGTNNSSPVLDESSIWPEMASRIKEKGTKPGIQLSSTWEGYKGQRKFISKGSNFDYYKLASSAFDESFVIKQIDSLNYATDIAIESGFEHIQLHAAHGYLFNLMCESAFCDFYEIIVDGVNVWLGKLRDRGIESSIRVSVVSGDDYIDKIRKPNFYFEKLNPDFFDLSEGFYNVDKRIIYPYSANIQKRISRQISLACAYPKLSFISSGMSYGLDEKIQPMIPDNMHIGICRDLIANPMYLVNRSQGCEGCSKCHYYSRGESQLYCPMWESYKS